MSNIEPNPQLAEQLKRAAEDEISKARARSLREQIGEIIGRMAFNYGLRFRLTSEGWELFRA